MVDLKTDQPAADGSPMTYRLAAPQSANLIEIDLDYPRT